MKVVDMKGLWSEFGLHMKAFIHVCAWSCAWWQAYTTPRGELMVGQTAWHTQVLSDPDVSIALAPATTCCWSKPLNVIPISSSLIMSVMVLDFDRKCTEKRVSQKKRWRVFWEAIWQQKFHLQEWTQWTNLKCGIAGYMLARLTTPRNSPDVVIHKFKHMVKDKAAHTDTLSSLLFSPGGGWHLTSQQCPARLPVALQFI